MSTAQTVIVSSTPTPKPIADLPVCAPSQRGMSSEEQEIAMQLERGDITVEELQERVAPKLIIPKLRCEDGPRKLIHSIPGEFHWPPIMRGSCDNLPGCRVPSCLPRQTIRRSVCVLVFKFINGRWVKVGYLIHRFVDHLSCECKQCKHVRSQKECVNTYACPNSDDECTFCFWNTTLSVGKRQVELAPVKILPFPFGRCDCCTPSCCPAPKRFNYDRCRCDCPSVIRCPTGQIFNRDTCKCECRTIRCPPGQIFNQKTCKCECVRVIRCPPGQIFNKKTCRCECARVIRCPPRQIFNGRTCKCECAQIIRCLPGQIFNPKTCKCECPNGSKMDDSGRCIGE